MKAQMGGTSIAVPIHNVAPSSGCTVNARPRRLYPEKETWYPLYRRLSGPRGRSGKLRKISSPPEFEPRTDQSVDSHYSDTLSEQTISVIVIVCMLRNYL